ncbi:MAG: hypothetical protein OHK0023_04460 [Anaerolineae bacterium]
MSTSKIMLSSQFLDQLQRVDSLLLQCAHVNDLYRQAVLLGRAQLGFDRLGVLLWENGHMIGTYGTDEYGDLRDESYSRNRKIQPEILAILYSKERVKVWQERTLYDFGMAIGRGWSIMAALWDGEQSLGWLATDNFVQRKPLEEHLVPLMTHYANIIARHITRLRHKTRLR